MPTFSPNERTVQVNVPASALPTVIQKAPQQQVQQTSQVQATPKSKRTIVLPFIHPPQVTQ